MSTLDWIAFGYVAGIPLIGLAALWQMYVVLNESHTLNRFAGSRKMLWVAVSLFFSFSLSLYWFCPNARKKGIVFALLGGAGVLLYGMATWFKMRLLAQQ
ncbi:hypothetical protein [Conchiformibius kuhniae]|uniref:Uncharacterized protein n=1 Tax=Conchiformibius kuhniae TaxID=211502 RepID=A0A8T9MXD4_9NEIS|nr:hypothetical protein [Conchiformibius kuhniae]UOP04862.1 hypothetical protein LVJ77_00300 [Conchiformibius kuhniae]